MDFFLIIKKGKEKLEFLCNVCKCKKPSWLFNNNKTKCKDCERMEILKERYNLKN